MPQESKKNKTGAIIFWILTAICMGVIFYFSSRSADESSAQSDFILALVRKIFGENAFSDFIVRKLAHFLEFTGLCVLTNSALVFTKGKRQLLFGIGIASAYAITDEVHQIFVEGRACQFTDWMIDTAGAITGALGFLVIYLVLDRLVQGRKAKI